MSSDGRVEMSEARIQQIQPATEGAIKAHDRPLPPIQETEEKPIDARNQRLEALLREVDFDSMSADELLSWASRTFPGRAVINTSFQYTGTAMIHMACTRSLDLRFATIDTLRLHPETYRFIEEIEARYECSIEIIQPDPEEVERMVRRFGEFLFFDSREKQEYCCQVRKLRPNNRLLQSVDCWISGLRLDQSNHRRETARKAEMAPEYGTRRKILKLNPLLDWSEERLRGYVEANDVPLHPLYAQGYPSFGCVICSTPTRSGEPKRAGRWRWFNENNRPPDVEDNKECGLHYNI